MNIALLVIDMQKEFFAGNSRQSMENAAGYINHAADLFRKNGKKIIWIQDENDDGSRRETPGFEIIDLLKPGDNEKRIFKRYDNGFNKTELPAYLSKEGIDTIVISGFCAEYCVLSTYKGALDLDLTPVILRNAIAGGINENVRFVESICELISIGALEKLIFGS